MRIGWDLHNTGNLLDTPLLLMYPEKVIQNLSVRDSKMTSRKIIIINGPSGVGKSTVSHILSRSVKKGVHIDVDILRHLVAEHRLTRGQIDLAYRNAAALTDNFLEAGYMVIVDGVFPTGKDLGIFCRALKTRNAAVYGYTLSGDVQVLQQREEMKTGSGKLRQHVRKLHNSMHADAGNLGVFVDTTDMGIMETVGHMRKLLARGIGRIKVSPSDSNSPARRRRKKK